MMLTGLSTRVLGLNDSRGTLLRGTLLRVTTPTPLFLVSDPVVLRKAYVSN